MPSLALSQDDPRKRVRDYLLAKYFPQALQQPPAPPAPEPTAPPPPPVDATAAAAPIQSPPAPSAPTAPPDPYSADERAKLANKNDAVAMIGQILSGLGDAYASAKGTGGTNFQGNSSAIVNARKNQDLSTFDAKKKEAEDNVVSAYISKKFGIPKGTSLAAGEKLAGMKQAEELKNATLEQTRDLKMLGMSDAKDKKDAAASDKKQGENLKRLQKLGEALDPSKQRQGAFGVSKQVFDRAERLESLANAFPDGNLDSRQVEELAIGLNAMLSGSNTGAQEQVKSLIPHTAIGNTQKMVEWLSNNPRGMQQQAFVTRMLGSIAREKETAAKQLNRTRFSRIAPYADLEGQSPEGFADTLRSNGVDPEEYKTWKKGGFKDMSAVTKPGEEKDLTPEDEQAIAWAKANASDPRATKILQMHGVQ